MCTSSDASNCADSPGPSLLDNAINNQNLIVYDIHVPCKVHHPDQAVLVCSVFFEVGDTFYRTPLRICNRQLYVNRNPHFLTWSIT